MIPRSRARDYILPGPRSRARDYINRIYFWKVCANRAFTQPKLSRV